MHVAAEGWTRRSAALALLALLAAAPASGRAADEPGPAAPPKRVAEMDLDELTKVRVSPFDVSADLDEGYHASNAVSGSRIDSPIRDLPFAIQAFTERFVRDQKAVNLFDVARFSPSVTYRSNDGTEGDADVSIRGFETHSTYRDGFRGPLALDLTDVARVEVVKGPASFLYGQVAPGGIVNVITKSPQPDFAATADATYGSYGQDRFRGDVTGPLSSTLSYRLVGSWFQDVDYWKPYAAHSWNVFPALRWEPSDRLSVTAKYGRYRKIEDPPLWQKPGYGLQRGVAPTASDPNLDGVSVPGLPDDWNSMSFGDFRHTESDSFSGWIDFRADEHWSLRASYAQLRYGVDALFTGNFGMSTAFPSIQGRRFKRQTYTDWFETYQGDAAGNYELGGVNVRLLLGAQAVEHRFDSTAAQAPNDPAVGPVASPLPDWNLSDPSTWNRSSPIPLSALTANRLDTTTRYEDRSVYGGVTVGLFGDRLLALAGGRWTHTTSRAVDDLTSQAGPAIGAAAVAPQGGLLLKVTPGVSLYGSYAESFLPPAKVLLARNVPVGPARNVDGRGYEGGLKADLLDGRLSGTLTFFQIEERNILNDLAELDPSTGVQVFTTLQSGVQRSRGVEVDATVTPVAGWQLYASYSYMDARIVDLTGRDAAILAQDPSTLDPAAQSNYRLVRAFHGARLQMSAPHLANLWTRYDVRRGARGGLYAGGGVNFVYDQTILPDGPPSTRQTYTLVSALVGYSTAWAGLPLTLDLSGKNLAGEQYRPSQSTRARPRELLLTLTARL